MSLSLPNANDIESWRRLGDGLHRLTWNGKPALLKRRARAPADFFRAELRGLESLRDTGTLRVPQVYAQGDDFLLLQDLGSGRPQLGDWRTAGERLAALHARCGNFFGMRWDGWCGDTPQSNSECDDGHRFFAERRLHPLADAALATGLLPSEDRHAIERICQRLNRWIPAQPASLIHGDLWLGNLHAAHNGELCLIDAAAAHYGWAEADLAMLCLFGTPPAALFDAYQACAGIDGSWRERAPLYNLYHLLNHLILFGPGYLHAVHRVLTRFA